MWGCFLHSTDTGIRTDLYCTLNWENLSSGKYYWKAITRMIVIVTVVAMNGDTSHTWRTCLIIPASSEKPFHSESLAHL